MEVVHGPKVQLIHHIGGDQSVLASMLVSTKGEESIKALTEDPAGSVGRIEFLMKNRHGTPFEANQFCFFIQAGIFVFREFHRHRVGWGFNETSGRYSKLEPIFYVPDEDRPIAQVGKPGAYTYVPGTKAQYDEMVLALTNSYADAYVQYNHLLRIGIAKEVARMVLPVGINSSMYATCNARSLMHFLSLRTYEPEAAYPSHPQYEIEQVARMMEEHFAELMPLTYAAWNKYGRVAP